MQKVDVKINDKSRVPLAPGFFLNTNLKVVLITMQFLDFTNTKNVKNYGNKFCLNRISKFINNNIYQKTTQMRLCIWFK